MNKLSFLRKSLSAVCLVFCVLFCSSVKGQELSGKALYNQIKNFSLDGGKAEVSQLTLKRDRAVMTFNGTFYFTSSIEGKVTGAVFIGQGTFRAEVPPSVFEKENVKRLLGADVVESDFKTAVLRFSDDTFDVIGKNKTDGATAAKAQSLASATESRFLEETGANLSSRLAVSIINKENPGFFFAVFDEGKRGRFNFLLDYQNRIPTSYFDINGGEVGLIFKYDSVFNNNEVWTAFYSLEDYQDKVVSYSDVNDLVDITDYKMDLDLRQPKTKLGLKAFVGMTALYSETKAIPFVIGESLSEFDNERLKKQMRLKSVYYGKESLEFVQEDWEGGLTVFLPKALTAGRKFVLDFEMEGDFIRQPDSVEDTNYPRSNTSWYPHHGYLDRATYEMSFLHSKKLKVATVGVRESEVPAENEDLTVTRYKMDSPVSFVTFALAPFKRFNEEIKWDSGEKPTMLEYNSLPYIQLKEDFIMAELNNSVRYFHQLFGQYPYKNYGATFHPFGFGQGFPSMLLIPATDTSNKYTYAFVAHETAHQWWGNIVAWRSYRDQWLSEGFAEYSGILYTGFRKDYKAAVNMIDDMRDSLKLPPRVRGGGLGKGKINDVGPIILGHRLVTSKTANAYQVLTYSKGALVLRMLHFLFTDPASGKGDLFFEMMKEFVEQHRNNVASTDDFRDIVNKYFVKTAIAQKYKINDLNWFFRQWVYETGLPSYTLEYSFQNLPDGSMAMNGSIIQENVSENWAMVLPVMITFEGNSIAPTSVLAVGSKSPFSIKLPRRPKKVELDSQKWILSEKTVTKEM